MALTRDEKESLETTLFYGVLSGVVALILFFVGIFMFFLGLILQGSLAISIATFLVLLGLIPILFTIAKSSIALHGIIEQPRPPPRLGQRSENKMSYLDMKRMQERVLQEESRP